MKRNEAIGLAMLIISGSLWGTTAVVSQWLAEGGITPLAVSTFRFVVGGLIIGGLALSSYGIRGFIALPRRDVLLMLFNGTMLTISQAAYLQSIPHAGVTIPTLIICCAAPLILAAFGAFSGREKLDRRVGFALIVTVVGTALLIGVPSEAGVTDLPLGVLLSAISTITYVGAIQAGHSLTKRYDPIRINAVGFAVGAAMLLVASAASGGLPIPDTGSEWALILYLGVFPSAIAYVTFVRGMRATSATISSIILLLEPLVAALLAAAILGERLSPLGLAGGALMCAGFLSLMWKRT